MGLIIRDFFAVSILCGIVFAIISYFFPDLGSPGGAVSTVVGAMLAGQFYGRRTGAEVSGGFAWKVAAILTAISLVLAGVLFWFLKSQGDPVLADLSAGILIASFAFLGVLSLLAIRFSFRFGVKQGVKTLKS